MTQFLLFRHGETDWNNQRIFQGHTDIRLNETGVCQAKALAEKVKYWKPDVIVCSDLTRALHTAEYSQMNWKVPLIQSAELREMNLGNAEGMHRDDVIKMVGPEMWPHWTADKLDHEHTQFFENGETKAQARARVINYLEKFTKNNPKYKKIAVSTHGGILKRVTTGLKGVPEEGIQIPNCVTYRLNYDGFGWHYVKVRERVSALVITQNKILTFFAVDPHSGHEYHFLPGGMIENNESIQQCAIRETFEETGYAIHPLDQIETSEYDFTWNNTEVWCRTHFIKADLKSDFNTPAIVKDADYNKGVRWIPVDDFASYFHYNESIYESLKKLI